MGRIQDRWVVGIDPGLICCGIVVVRNNIVENYATFKSAAGDDYWRAEVLAQTIINWLADKLPAVGLVKVGIELPVWTHSPVTYMKQARTIQAIEAALFAFTQLEIVEIYPSTSKARLTGKGSATKQDMIDSGPFRTLDLPRESLEAVADAYGHANAVASEKKAAAIIRLPRSIEMLKPLVEG